jgi:hypothetical protein
MGTDDRVQTLRRAAQADQTDRTALVAWLQAELRTGGLEGLLSAPGRVSSLLMKVLITPSGEASQLRRVRGRYTAIARRTGANAALRRHHWPDGSRITKNGGLWWTIARGVGQSRSNDHHDPLVQIKLRRRRRRYGEEGKLYLMPVSDLGFTLWSDLAVGFDDESELLTWLAERVTEWKVPNA